MKQNMKTYKQTTKTKNEELMTEKNNNKCALKCKEMNSVHVFFSALLK